MILMDICIKRPVLATVLNLIVLLIGLISFFRLTVREYPNIDVPVVNVQTNYPGANSQIIESEITTPLEDSISGIDGIDYIISNSRDETSLITVRFKLKRDPNAAVSDIRDRVSRVRDRIPDKAKEPIISKVEADAQPIIWLAFTSDRYSPLDVTDFADRLVKDRIQTISGVADVRIFGERKYTMRVWADPKRLASYQLTPQDIEDALLQQNLELPAGRIEGRDREFSVLAATDLNTVTEFSNIILKNADGFLIRMKDIGLVNVAPFEERSIVRFKGKTAIALGVIKQSTANPLEVAKELKKLLPNIEKTLPPGVNIEVAYDTTVFIRASIDAVYDTMFEATILVILVIYFFLRSFRGTLIPLVTIPVSLIGAFAIMYLLNFSINTLSLLALVLAIGLVVDDAIVVLENIHRHIEEGLSPFKAAILGSQEIGFAIIAMTFTLAAVFVPLSFSTGRTGKLFIEFALTLAGAVMVSGFVALTLSPMMCSRLLKKESHKPSLWLQNHYHRLLEKALEIKNIIFIFVIGVGVVMIGLFLVIKSELAPMEDRGIFLTIAIAPDGSTPEYSDKYGKQIENIIKSIPEVEKYFLAIGYPTVTRSIAFTGLEDWDKRKRSQETIVQEVAPKLFRQVTGLLAFPMNPPPLGQSIVQRPIEIVLQTTGSYDELQSTLNKVVTAARKNSGIKDIDTDLKLNNPRLKIEVDRDKISSTGVEVGTVSRAIETMIAGRQVTRFKRYNKQYDVIIQVPKFDRRHPSNIDEIYVRNKSQDMIPLSNLVKIKETVSPQELNHFNKLRAATITASLAPGYSLEEGLKFMVKTIEEQAVTNIQYDYGGFSREFQESQQAIYLIFALAICFIYLVLAAQFESFMDPFIILLSVPLAMVGALLTLLIFGGTLNIYSQIGLITLVGLISKHGILIVAFANQLREKGKPLKEAVIEAATIRLRPILMTTAAMVLGAIPLTLATGAGSEARIQMGWVIVGGMLFGTLLTLFVVPAMYSFFAKYEISHLEDENTTSNPNPKN